VNTTAKHWINGEWLAIGRETPSINPADGKPIGSYFDGGGAAARAAIDVSFTAFHQSDWRRNGMARATALSHLADVFASRLSELIDTLLGERKTHGRNDIRGDAHPPFTAICVRSRDADFRPRP
jgi:betaine-aldehyde dehydrogenase